MKSRKMNSRNSRLTKTLLTVLLCFSALYGCDSKEQKEDRSDMKLDVLGNIEVCVREEGSGTREVFSKNVVDTKEWDSKLNMLNENSEVLKFVVNNKGAIGYVSKASVVNNNAIFIVETESKLSRPFNIVNMGELGDVEKDFISYVLSQGQVIIGESYEKVRKENTFLSDKSKGTIKIGGSSSMSGLVAKLADDYMTINPNATIAVVTSDSSAGINSTLNGSYDLGMVSRELKDYELELLDTRKIAEDEIAIITNNINPVGRLTDDELRKIYKMEYTVWSDLK